MLLRFPRADVSRASWAGSPEGLELLPRFVRRATAALARRRPRGPLPGRDVRSPLQAVGESLGPAALPSHGVGADKALDTLADFIASHGIDLSHPHAAAHLQPPPLTVAVAADTLASALNASVDTFDSGPASIAVERWVVGALAREANLPIGSDGVLTPGGSISNLVALMLARDATARTRGGNASRYGAVTLPRPVVYCSEAAHFSVHRACAVLGLGEEAVRTVPVGPGRTMDPRALDRALSNLSAGDTPVAVVATAGTTDFGTVDPLPEIAHVAQSHRIWFHVDAAYGFGCLFSDRLAPRLRGLERADSVTLDLHKLGWQPAATSVLLVARQSSFSPLDRSVPYLNPADDCSEGLDGLLGRSLQTTRRADALKVAATFLACGREQLGRMVEDCHDAARYAQRRIESESSLELVSPAALTTVVFRYVPTVDGCRARRNTTEHVDENELNGRLRRRLLKEGRVLIGRTTVADRTSGSERVCLKFTFVNPTIRPADIDSLIDAVLDAGTCVEAEENTQRDTKKSPRVPNAARARTSEAL